MNRFRTLGLGFVAGVSVPIRLVSYRAFQAGSTHYRLPDFKERFGVKPSEDGSAFRCRSSPKRYLPHDSIVAIGELLMVFSGKNSKGCDH